MKDVFIVAAKRTPFGTVGGTLSSFTATDLLEQASKAALAAGNVDPKIVNSTISGMVCSVGTCSLSLSLSLCGPRGGEHYSFGRNVLTSRSVVSGETTANGNKRFVANNHCVTVNISQNKL